MLVPMMSRERLLERLKAAAHNSSHFVWLLGDFELHETPGGWLFAYVRRLDTAVAALEPLPPAGESPSATDSLRSAVEHFCRGHGAARTVFVGVSEDFQAQLRGVGFQGLQIGREPWVDLAHYWPSGSSARGVRAAKNQAIRAGVIIEEWDGATLNAESERGRAIREIWRAWSSAGSVELNGFLHSSDPLAHSSERRYFVARTGSRIEGFLIATPVYATGRSFFEDMMFRPDAARGCSELLLLEAMAALQRSGVPEVSLGVVSLQELAVDPACPPPRGFLAFAQAVRLVARVFYNSGGIELFRKRFKPRRWSATFVSFRPPKGRSPSVQWIVCLAAIILSFNPRLRHGARGAIDWARRPFVRHPVASAWIAICSATFLLINRGGDLPEAAFERFGFSAERPVVEWLYRTVTSDFLAVDLSQFLTLTGISLLLLPALERRIGSRLLGLTLGASVLLDDFLNYWLVIKPFEHSRMHLFNQLVQTREVGSSLVLSLFFGLKVFQLRKGRELLLTGTIVLAIVGLHLTAPHALSFVLSINHLIFFVLGYVLGLALLEARRRRSRLIAKLPTPVAVRREPGLD
jgi:hypothetical protein